MRYSFLEPIDPSHPSAYVKIVRSVSERKRINLLRKVILGLETNAK